MPNIWTSLLFIFLLVKKLLTCDTTEMLWSKDDRYLRNLQSNEVLCWSFDFWISACADEAWACGGGGYAVVAVHLLTPARCRFVVFSGRWALRIWEIHVWGFFFLALGWKETEAQTFIRISLVFVSGGVLLNLTGSFTPACSSSYWCPLKLTS